jgi:hypothetical protein
MAVEHDSEKREPVLGIMLHQQARRDDDTKKNELCGLLERSDASAALAPDYA